jgi:hypothetical protein
MRSKLDRILELYPKLGDLAKVAAEVGLADKTVSEVLRDPRQYFRVLFGRKWELASQLFPKDIADFQRRRSSDIKLKLGAIIDARETGASYSTLVAEAKKFEIGKSGVAVNLRELVDNDWLVKKPYRFKDDQRREAYRRLVQKGYYVKYDSGLLERLQAEISKSNVFETDSSPREKTAGI